jgi:GNAT superfamily N-acetyltransferase
MQQPSTLHEAMGVYFAAKERMFAHVPAFRLLHVGPLTCFHNHPGWPEVDGFYAVDGEAEPPKVIDTVRAYQPDPEHMVTVFTTSPESILRSYEELEYQPLPDPQPFMSKSLAALPATQETAPVFRVETLADVSFINSGEEVMDPAHFNNGLYRYYYMPCDGKPVCWGRCVIVSPETIYIAGMETAPEYRRRGLATALMNRMHTDAVGSGAKQSILCSTSMGYGLYNKVGYALLAHMQAFVPRATNVV